MESSPRERLDRPSRSHLLGWASVVLSCALSLEAGAKPQAATQRGAPSASHDAPAHDVLLKAEALGAAVVALRALKEERGLANHERPLYTLAAAQPKNGEAHLCIVERPSLPAHCVAPGPRPVPPSMPPPPCAWCDDAPKEEAWKRYIQQRLGTDALHALLELHRAVGYFGQHARLCEDFGEALKVIGGRDQRGAALEAELGALVKAGSDAARERELTKELEAVLSALELSLTADDLSTEGGLKAAIKLSASRLRSSRVRWQTEFAKWAKCHNDALSSGKLARDDEAATERCNDDASGYGPQHASAWKSVFDWEKRRDTYRVCLQSNVETQLALAKHQKLPCPPGTKP